MVNPERDPGQADDEDAGNVGLGEVEADLTFQNQLGVQARECTLIEIYTHVIISGFA